MSPQRPFLSSFFAAFRQQSPSQLPQASSSSSSASQQPTTPQTSTTTTNKQPSPSTTTTSYSVSTNTPPTTRGIAAQAAAAAAAASASAAAASVSASASASSQSPQSSQSQSAAAARGVTSPRGIPIPQHPSRRGSDSSSEGFREVLGADKMYIGGRTAAGEDRYFKLGVVRRVRSGDRLSLDRLSL